MKEETGLFKDVIKNLKALDGQELAGGMQKEGIKLAKDDRGAWINHMADQCAMCVSKEKVDIPPSELNISNKDVIKELVQRKIREAFGG